MKTIITICLLTLMGLSAFSQHESTISRDKVILKEKIGQLDCTYNRQIEDFGPKNGHYEDTTYYLCVYRFAKDTIREIVKTIIIRKKKFFDKFINDLKITLPEIKQKATSVHREASGLYTIDKAVGTRGIILRNEEGIILTDVDGKDIILTPKHVKKLIAWLGRINFGSEINNPGK